MSLCYIHCKIDCEPKSWLEVSNKIRLLNSFFNAESDFRLYGVWRSQIGLPRDVLTVMLTGDAAEVDAAQAERLFDSISTIRQVSATVMTPTLRPQSPEPPTRQGNYAFRWFETPSEHYPEFLALCESAWPSFESSFDSQVLGLWRMPEDEAGQITSLLLTRRPDLSVWEKSKKPTTAEEIETRKKLSRRYDLCDWTVVYTTTLLTAIDGDDTTRWT